MIIASTTIKHNQLAEENLSSTKIATTDRRVTPFRQKYQYHPTIIVMKNVAPRRNDKDESYGRNNSDNQSLHPSTSLRYSAYEVEQLHSHVPRRNSVAEVEPLRPPIPRARCTTKVESLHLPASRRHSAAEAGHGNHDNIDVNSCDEKHRGGPPENIDQKMCLSEPAQQQQPRAQSRSSQETSHVTE